MNHSTGSGQADRPLAERLRERLEREHRGRARGISCRHLARELDATERTVREAVTELRRAEGQPGAHPDHGYYWIVSPDDLDLSCAFLRSRAVTSLELAAMLRKVSLADMAGQLALELREERR